MILRLILNVIMVGCYYIKQLVLMLILGGFIWCSFAFKYEKKIWDIFFRKYLKDRIASVLLVFMAMISAYVCLWVKLGAKCIVCVLLQSFVYLLWKRRKESELKDDVNLLVTAFLLIVAIIFID